MKILILLLGFQPLYAEPVLEMGKAVYNTTCFACHGKDGKGVFPGVPNFRKSKKSDKELLEVLREGLNRPGTPLAMPSRGGVPTLTEEETKAVIAFIRKRFIPAPKPLNRK